MVVLVNGDSGDPAAIAGRIGQILPLASRPSAAETERARAFLEALRAGRIEPTAMTEAGLSFFTPVVLQDHVGSLGGLGPLKAFAPQSRTLRGGFTQEVYRADFEKQSLRIVVRAQAGGGYEQFMVTPG